MRGIHSQHVDTIRYNSRFVREVMFDNAIGICPDRTSQITVQTSGRCRRQSLERRSSDTGANDHDLPVEGMRDYLSSTFIG